MTVKKICTILYLCLFFVGNFSFAYAVSPLEQQPLDSLKQVLRQLAIPYDIQEDWMEELEDLEDRQDSPQFRRLLVKVDQEIKAYLVDKENYAPKQSKKNSFKNRLNKVGKGIAQTVSQGISSAETALLLEKGKTAENKSNYAEAIHHYKKAVLALEEQKKWKKWAEVQEDIAHLMAKLRDFDGALEILPLVKDKMRELGDGSGMRRIDTRIKNLQKNLDITTIKEAPVATLPKPVTTPTPPVVPSTRPPTPNVSDIDAQMKKLKKQEQEVAQRQATIKAQKKEEAEMNARLAEAERNGRSSREIAQLKKEKNALRKAMQKEEAAAEKLKQDLMEQQLDLAQKQSEIDKQALAQRNLYGGLAILGILLFSTFFMYRSKKKDHKKLAVAYEELEEAQEELKLAEQKIKGLLDQQVSGAVAAELLSENGTGGSKHERRFVCVMFLDIRNFTPFVESKTPEEIIEYQNNVLGFMMEKVIEHGGIVNTVLGDGFMATFGAPVSAGNDCLQAYKAAVEIMQMVREKSRTGQIPPTKIGIGMHAGNVVAGNVGTKTRKQYLVTGNTVIIASRLEQLNKQYGSSLIISREVVERLPVAMNLPKVFDQVMVKGRSKPVEIAKYG